MDFPALGGPRIATRNPSRSRSEAGAEASALSIEASVGASSALELAGGDARDLRLVGKVEIALDARHRLDDRAAPALRLAPQGAAGEPQRLASLESGARLDQIGERFNLRKIELAIEKGRRANSPGSAERSPGARASAASTPPTTAEPP